MKKPLFFTVFLIILAFVFIFFESNYKSGFPTEDISSDSESILSAPSDQNIEGDLLTEIFNQKGLVIFRFNKNDHGLKYVMNNDNLTTKDIVIKHDLLAAINGGFFLKDLSHAGLLKIEGVVYVNLAPIDKQLNGVIYWQDSKVGIAKIDKNLDIKYFDSAIQTGPVMILDSVIQEEPIKSSVNGMTNHLRSIFGYDSTYYYFIYTVQPYSLLEVASLLVEKINEYEQSLNFINLDGGSSTSFYITKNESASFRSFKILPFLLGIFSNYQTSKQ